MSPGELEQGTDSSSPGPKAVLGIQLLLKNRVAQINAFILLVL